MNPITPRRIETQDGLRFLEHQCARIAVLANIVTGDLKGGRDTSPLAAASEIAVHFYLLENVAADRPLGEKELEEIAQKSSAIRADPAATFPGSSFDPVDQETRDRFRNLAGAAYGVGLHTSTEMWPIRLAGLPSAVREFSSAILSLRNGDVLDHVYDKDTASTLAILSAASM